MDIKKYLPKESKYALLKVKHDTLYFVKEGDDLPALLEDCTKPELGASKYVIDGEGTFQHKLTLNQSLDIRSVR